MTVKEVTNEEIFDAIKNLSADLSAFKSEMYAFRDEMYSFREEMYRFREETCRRFEYLEKRMDRLEQRQEEDRKMLMDVWQSRNGVTVKFSRAFVFINALISAVTAGTVSFGVNKSF